MITEDRLTASDDRVAMVKDKAIGVMLPRDLPAGDVVNFVQRADDLGFDELWVVEDCFFRGGIAQAAVALASTRRISIGIGILPAAVRNPVFTALEVATLAELYPGRLQVGIGHGMGDWMQQIGERPASPLTMLDEHLQVVRSLLRGERVTIWGRYQRLDDVVLHRAPDVVPPVLAGVRGPKSLQLAGRSADGTILAEPVTPEYLSFARQQIGTASGHRIVGYNFCVIDDDARVARRQVRPALAWIGDPDWAPHIAPLSFAAEFAELRKRSASSAEFVERMPDEWIDQLAVVGSASSGRHRVHELHAAGANSVVLIPLGADPSAAMEAIAAVL